MSDRAYVPFRAKRQEIRHTLSHGGWTVVSGAFVGQAVEEMDFTLTQHAVEIERGSAIRMLSHTWIVMQMFLKLVESVYAYQNLVRQGCSAAKAIPYVHLYSFMS